METIHDAAMLQACSLTARQLKEATLIVEAEHGASPERRSDVLIAAVLDALARNYGMRLAAAGR